MADERVRRCDPAAPDGIAPLVGKPIVRLLLMSLQVANQFRDLLSRLGISRLHPLPAPEDPVHFAPEKPRHSCLTPFLLPLGPPRLACCDRCDGRSDRLPAWGDSQDRPPRGDLWGHLVGGGAPRDSRVSSSHSSQAIAEGISLVNLTAPRWSSVCSRASAPGPPTIRCSRRLGKCYCPSAACRRHDGKISPVSGCITSLRSEGNERTPNPCISSFSFPLSRALLALKSQVKSCRQRPVDDVGVRVAD